MKNNDRSPETLSCSGLSSACRDTHVSIGQRVIHVIVPGRVFNYVKAQAALSGLTFKAYMTKFLLEAFPYEEQDHAEVERVRTCTEPRACESAKAAGSPTVTCPSLHGSTPRREQRSSQ